MTQSSGQPYRFLDNYRFTPDDIKVFHGRKREAALLVSELTTNRLVVLFAPTGTGKSSLINAGVRPFLEATGYKTVMVRVDRDPDRSLRAALAGADLSRERAQPASLGKTVRDAIAEAGRPLVIFLDQFEEFFLYVQREDPARARQFIADIAELYRDRSAGAHFAFSMREDFFIEMDVFRDEIPTIFQQNSGLRLRALRPDQAREAIRLPALQFGVSFDDDLVAEKPAPGKREALLDDLAAIGSNGLIAPIHLQVVCDTLWKRRPQGNRITSALYKEIGPVVRILDDRFRTDIAETLTDGELLLFARLLPLLRSDEGRGTKSVAAIDLLIEKLQTDSATLGALIDKLEDLRLLNRGAGATVNWASDYLSGRLDHLLWAARSTYFRRVLSKAMRKSAAQTAQPAPKDAPRPQTTGEMEALFMSRIDFEDISNQWRYLGPPPGLPGDPASQPALNLSQNEIRFLFEASLEHGYAVEFWCEHAAIAGIDVMAELQARIFDPAFSTEQAANAVRAMVRIGTPQAMEVLRQAIDKTVWSPLIVTELGASANPPALAILRNWLKETPPAPPVAQYLALNWCSEARTLLAGIAPRESDPIPAARGSVMHAPPAASPTAGLDLDMEDREWELLVRRIRDGKLIPVIGMASLAGSAVHLLMGHAGYPLRRADIDSLAQFRFGREAVVDAVTQAAAEERSESVRTASALAALPLPYYLTTRYDDGITNILREAGKQPQIQYPEWNGRKPDTLRVEASPAAPLVYHLHGHSAFPDSLVLTLQDAFSFLGASMANPAVVSLAVQASLANSTVIFLDYDPPDAEFQSVLTIFHRIRAARRSAICVPTLAADVDSVEAAGVRSLYQDFLTRSGIRVVWSSPSQFAERLRSKWEATFHDAKE